MKELEYKFKKGKIKNLESDIKVWINGKCKYKISMEIMKKYEINEDELEWNHYVYINKQKK